MGVLDIIFPKSCLGCGQGGEYICQKCVVGLKPAAAICPYCRAYSYNGRTHSRCIRKYGIDGQTSLWRYSGTMRKAIHMLKYRYASDSADQLVKLVLDEFQSRWNGPLGQCVASIPLEIRRERKRGYNQASLLGEKLAVELGLAHMNGLLTRRIYRKPQVGLTKKERLRNIRGVFAVNQDVLSENKGKSVLLFDDVWTTGATMFEATRVLKKAGIKKVWGLTVCG